MKKSFPTPELITMGIPFNPFQPVTQALMDSWIQDGKWLAAQSFPRGYPVRIVRDKLSPLLNKTCLLFTPYKSRFEAERHVEQLTDDPYRAVIDLHVAKHIETVRHLVLPQSNYYLYNGHAEHLQAALAQAAKGFEYRLWHYLSREVDIYPVSPFNEPPYLEIQYGEIYLFLGKGPDRWKIKLSTIESIELVSKS